MQVVRDETYAAKVGRFYGEYVGSADLVKTESGQNGRRNGTVVEVHFFVHDGELIAYVAGQGKLQVAAAAVDDVLSELETYAEGQGFPGGPKIIFTGTRWRRSA